MPKKTVELSEKGTRALVALCHHVAYNGNTAQDARWLARLLLGTVVSGEEAAELWAADEDRPGRPESLKRLAEARAAFRPYPDTRRK